MQTIRAIYKDGQIQPLEPVDLVEGEKLQVIRLSEEDRITELLGDLLVKFPPLTQAEEAVDEAELMRSIQEGFKGINLSEILMEERRNSP